MDTIIRNATIVNEGRTTRGSVLIHDNIIQEVYEGDAQIPDSRFSSLNCIDADGALLLPGIIDTHVHFREPGLTHKADIASESTAAAAGGVTLVLDMPNVVPPTTTLLRWQERMALGLNNSRVNYGCYMGTTADARKLEDSDAPAIKLFMGSSTGDMLVEGHKELTEVFRRAAEIGVPIVVHCEDPVRISQRMAEAKQQWGEDPEPKYHAWIRDAEACYRSSSLAVKLAEQTGARLHLAHITTAKELSLLNGTNVTGEVCVPHLLFCDEDYDKLGSLIKCNPAIKTRADRDALRQALADGRLSTIGTDHAPHLLAEKQGGCVRATSGMPMVQFSLVSMMSLVDEGVLTLERMVDAMCHKPATLFGINQRGYIRKGYKADLVIVRSKDWTLHKEDILSKCAWSPLEGREFHWKVEYTFVNGQLAYSLGKTSEEVRGEAILRQR